MEANYVSFMFAPVMMLLSMFSGGGLPLGLPPGDADPHMAQIAPEECLAYLSWSGSVAPDAANENEFEKLLAEPEVQFMFSEIERLMDQAFEQMERHEGPDNAKLAKQGVTWARRFLTRPGAVFISKFDVGAGPPDIAGGLVLTVGDEGEELKDLWEKIRVDAPEEAVREVKIGGVTMYRVQVERDAPPITVGIKGEYLYAGIGDGSVEEILKRTKTAPPKWLTDLQKQLVVDRPSVITYINAESIGDKLSQSLLGNRQGTALLTALDVANLQSFGSVSGLDESGFVTRSLIGLKGKPTGLLASAIGKPLTLAELQPIPKDATFAVAARFDAANVFDTALATFEKVAPGSGDEIRGQIGAAEEELGFRIREDLLGGLGDTIFLYHSSGEGGLLGGFAAVVGVKDRKKLEPILAKVKKTLSAVAEIGGGFGFGPRLGTTEFGDDEINFLKFVESGFPLSPAWCLRDDVLIFGLFPQTVRAYLARGADYESLANVSEVASVFKNGNAPSKLVYQDTRAVFQLAYPFVQIAMQMISGEFRREGVDVDVSMLPSGQSIARHLRPDVLTVTITDAGIEITNRQSAPGSNAAMYLPALMMVATVRTHGPGSGNFFDGLIGSLSPDRAREQASLNNLKMIALAMHNYHDVYGKFPAAYTVDEDGKPLLSWRVAILPFIEENALYERFRLDEPWDSAHNKELIPLMSKVYHAPGSAQMPGMTNYVTIRGEKTIFPGKDAQRMATITDGTSLTLLTLEVGDERAVVWSKPDDYSFDPMNPIKGIVGLRRGAFLCGFADGSVRKIRDTVDKELLMRLFERNDGQVIDFDSIDAAAGNRPRVRIDRVPAVAVPRPAPPPEPKPADSPEKPREK